MNEEKPHHILNDRRPIEFLHRHKKATIHQRELHSDKPSCPVALRAALRQAPRVTLVGKMRDRETTEMVLEASETGHLVLSTLHTIDASKTIERIGSKRRETIKRNAFARRVQLLVSEGEDSHQKRGHRPRGCRRDSEVHNARIHRKGRSADRD